VQYLRRMKKTVFLMLAVLGVGLPFFLYLRELALERAPQA
jgi:hypothetical protein